MTWEPGKEFSILPGTRLDLVRLWLPILAIAHGRETEGKEAVLQWVGQHLLRATHRTGLDCWSEEGTVPGSDLEQLIVGLSSSHICISWGVTERSASGLSCTAWVWLIQALTSWEVFEPVSEGGRKKDIKSLVTWTSRRVHRPWGHGLPYSAVTM